MKYPGDAVFETGAEFSQGAADYADEQRLERAKEIAGNPNQPSSSLPSASRKFAEPQAHSPGPWSTDYECGLYDARGYNLLTGGVERRGEHDEASWVAIKHADDARLIAAAPTMLAALQDCVAALDSDAMQSVWPFLYAHNFQWTGPTVDMIRARAAIAKATGAPHG